MKNLLPISLSSKRGFTIMELLVVSVILVIIMGSIAVVFVQANRSWNQTEAKLQIYQNARESLNRMSRELSSVYQPSNVNQHLTLTDNSDADTLMFTAALNNPDNAGEYDLSHIGYRLNSADKEIERYKKDYDGSYDGSTLDSNAWSTLATNVIALNFRCYDEASSSWVDQWSAATLPKSVEITVATQDKNQRKNAVSFTTKIYLPTS